MTTPPTDERPAWHRAVKNRLFAALCVLATSVSVIALGVLLTAIVTQGYEHLNSIDDDAVEEARQPQPPDVFTDLGRVDWAAMAADPGPPVLGALADVGWSRVGREQELEFAEDVELVDWTLVADVNAEHATALSEIAWLDVVDASTIPGRGRLGALWAGSEFADFVTAAPSRKPEKAGIGPALVGTIWICAVCAIFALPLGVGTAIFLEEYPPRNRFLRAIHGFVQLNITNLAGVPSIVYGIIGLTAFVQMFGVFGNLNAPMFTIGTPDDWYYVQFPFGRGVFAGGLTLMLVILPIVIISAQEALRAVPGSLREGSLALGATRWQMIRRMTLPSAIPGIMTGSILAMSRAIGEAAPVLIICGIVFIRFTPQHLMDEFTALPLQIYDWAGRPQEAFHAIAASGILILLATLLTFNAFAILVRQKFQRPLQ
ncbi:MAG: phosphate ABC transporter permease PstA [Planctomycetota bacterium]|jgi:phosphate transport system permease protein